MTLLLVMLGAAAGAPARWLVDRAVAARHDSVFPWGTFAVNVTGSFLLGALAAALPGDGGWFAALGTGFCGAFTTFSTFSYENVRLIEDGSGQMAARNVGASLVAGMLAVYAGWLLGAALAG